MELQKIQRQGGSAGGIKIYVLAALILAGAIFVASKFGPIYSAKWELEDKMEDIMKRYVRLGDEGIADELQAYVDEVKLNFNVYDNCKFEGEVDGPGTWTCFYYVPLGLPKYEKTKVIAIVKSPRILNTSN